MDFVKRTLFLCRVPGLRLVPCLVPFLIPCVVLCLVGPRAALSEPPAAGPGAPAGDAPVPQENFLSSLKQAFKQDFDNQVVRGHFEVGSPPDAHRYYCLVDANTGKKQPNGVSGQPLQRKDGMTGIKATAVSLYSCASSEQQGILVTDGYGLTGAAAYANSMSGDGQARSGARNPGAAAPGAATSPVAASPDIVGSASVAATSAVGTVLEPRQPADVEGQPARLPNAVDVAGVKLGMSADEIRAVLRGKLLLHYSESMALLRQADSSGGNAQPAAAGRFVNVIAAWTTSSASAVDDTSGGNGESYQVMFTPLPGRERAMAIVHTLGYAPADAPQEALLTDGLVKKYGGFATSRELPQGPTWRVQHNGEVQSGDACDRRGLFGGLAELNPVMGMRPNAALNTALDEFRYQIDRCGLAIVTEDHATSNTAAPRAARLVTRYTVTAYSPSIGFEGALAAEQLMALPAGTGAKAPAAHPSGPVIPIL